MLFAFSIDFANNIIGGRDVFRQKAGGYHGYPK